MRGIDLAESNILTRLSSAQGWILDVDGCIMRTTAAGGNGGEPIPGAVELVRWLKARGRKVIACTNASQKTAAQYAADLRALGFDIEDREMVTAATAAAATIVRRHGAGLVMAIGDVGLQDALEAAGARLWTGGEEAPRAVIVGDAEHYSARAINEASLAIAQDGASFYVTVNMDWFHGGVGRSVTLSSAIACAIQSATTITPTVCGKPSEAIARLLCERLGCAADDIVVVGDMASIEVRMARAMGAGSVLVLSGGTSREEFDALPAELYPDICMDDVGALLQALEEDERRREGKDDEGEGAMSSQADRFAFFHETAAPDGAEGWERLYPYFLVSQREGQEAEDGKFWFAEPVHWPSAVHPFDSVGVEAVYYGAGYNSARSIALPTSLGLDVRMVNGFVYISPQPVVDEEEIGKRAALFEDRAGFYYQNWDNLYSNWKEKMQASIEVMKNLRFDRLPEFEPLEVVKEGKGRSVSWDLIENFHRLINEFFLVWQYHFEKLGLGYGAYMMFFQFCKESFPEIEDQAIARMVAGVEGIMFRPEEELRRLARRAVELNVTSGVCRETDSETILKDLAQSDAGRDWVQDFTATREPWFNYFSESGFLHDHKTWNENLSVPLEGIARYIRCLETGEDIDRPVERLRAEREQTAERYRGMLPEEEAKRFDQSLALARQVFPYIEEHNIYVEHWSHAVFWKKVRELSDVLVQAGMFKADDDLYYLNRFELDQVLFDVVESWAIGAPPRGVQHWQAEIERRRAIMAALRTATPVPAYGVPPAEVSDPFAVMNFGITTERVADWLGQADPDVVKFKGIPASPGVAEGPVRVVRREEEIGKLQAGEILVAMITAPSWAPVLPVAAGVVTDIGGMMSHAAMVCREYGMPAVVSTGFASSRLQTGQRVRVDGRAGTVTLL